MSAAYLTAPPPPPASLKQEVRIISALNQERAYRQFLEAGLSRLGDTVGLPWWTVHLVLLLGTSALTEFLIDVPRLFPRLGHAAFWTGTIAECVFTTYLLSVIRQTREQGFLLAARIPTGTARLAWVRTYLDPSLRGWRMPASPVVLGPVRTPPLLSPLSATLALLLLFYLLLAVLDPIAPTTGLWSTLQPHLIWIYPHTCKAALLVAALAWLWSLAGATSLARLRTPSRLTRDERKSVRRESERTARQLVTVVALATGLWMFAHGLAYGTTVWSWLLSAGLGVLVTTAFRILRDRFPVGASTAQKVRRERPPDHNPWFMVIPSLAPDLGLLAALFSPPVLNWAGACFEV